MKKLIQKWIKSYVLSNEKLAGEIIKEVNRKATKKKLALLKKAEDDKFERILNSGKHYENLHL